MTKIRSVILLIALVFTLACVQATTAEQSREQPDMTIDASTRAEEFTYNLKNLKRATIVGETTGGGAHPGGTSRINGHFLVWVPRGRAINPISKPNWEGTGVEPDVKVPAEEALKTAHLAAVNKIIEKTSDQRRKGQLNDVATTLQKELDELKKNQKPSP